MENLQKARIINLKTRESFTCQFNPEEYTFSKQSSWQNTAGKGKDVQPSEYSHGQPATLKMKLFFDTSKTADDVREVYTNKLLEMMKISKPDDQNNKGEPPRVQFVWGPVPSFTAVINNITQRFTMFLGNGTPVRAMLDVSFKEVKDDKEQPPQNPTTRSQSRRTRRVRLGDRIDLIAFEAYGSANYWYELALANEIDNPLELEPGQILKIPTLT